MTDMDYVRILRDLREDADKTQTQIAQVLGTSQTMYARYERGANELPIHHLITLSKYYGVSTDYLLRGQVMEGDTRLLNQKVSSLTPCQYRHLENIIDNFIAAIQEEKEV